MKCKRTWIVPVLWLAVLTPVVLSFAPGGDGMLGQGVPPQVQRAPKDRAMAHRHFRVNSQMVDFSQHIREHVDFLLTPALLVQEAISDGVILTYPVE